MEPISMTLGAIETFGLSCVALAAGLILSTRVKVINRYNIPAAVVGGLAFCLALLLLRKLNFASFTFTKSFEPPLMQAFFASIGFAASFETLKKGGKAVLSFLLICAFFTLLQNILGIFVANAFGLHPLFGVLTGSVALTGGPGTAMAFAKSFSDAGVAGAEVAGISAALCGIIIGGLIGSPVATHMIQKFSLKTPGKIKKAIRNDNEINHFEADHFGIQLMRQFIFLGVVLWIGVYISQGFEALAIKLPGYIGTMLAAAAIRNLGDHVLMLKVNTELMDEIGNVSLSLFLSSALVSLEIWKISAVALPLIVVLALQTLLIVVAAYYVIYKTSGENYDAAVISAGFIGFMMGTTANAMSNMKSVVDRYGNSHRAFLVVPIVGACFIDFINATMISGFLNFFK